MNKQIKKGFNATYLSGFGNDVDLTEANCSAETWTFLSRPDKESKQVLRGMESLI